MLLHVYLGPLLFLAAGGLFLVVLLLHRRPRRISVVAFLPLLVVVAAVQLALNWLHRFVGDAVTGLLVTIYVVGAVITARRRSPS